MSVKESNGNPSTKTGTEQITVTDALKEYFSPASAAKDEEARKFWPLANPNE